MIMALQGELSDLVAADQSMLEHTVLELLRAHREGHHLVIFPRAVSKYLLENFDFGSRDRATLERLAADYTQTASLLASAASHLSIVVNHRSGVEVRGASVVVGLDDVQHGYTFDRSALVVEDQNTDGQLYLKILEACRHKVRAENIALDIRHGGGERSAEVLRTLSEEKRIALLITDSDNSYPREGEPAKVLRYKREVAGNPLAQVAHTPCREIENMIPLDVLEGLPCVHGRAADIAAFRKIDAEEKRRNCAPHESFWWFYDLKNGVNREQLEKVSGEELRGWISQKIGVAPSKFVGFGDRIVPQLLASHLVLAKFLKMVRASCWWDLFGSIIEKMLWIGFAPAKQRL